MAAGRAAVASPVPAPSPPCRASRGLHHDRAMVESLLGFKRAGASGVLTYFAVGAARLPRG